MCWPALRVCAGFSWIWACYTCSVIANGSEWWNPSHPKQHLILWKLLKKQNKNTTHKACREHCVTAKKIGLQLIHKIKIKKSQTSLSSPRAVFRCGCVCMKVDLVIMLITVQCLLFECFKPIHLSFSPVQLFSSLFMCRKPLSWVHAAPGGQI